MKKILWAVLACMLLSCGALAPSAEAIGSVKSSIMRISAAPIRQRKPREVLKYRFASSVFPFPIAVAHLFCVPLENTPAIADPR